MKFYHQIRKSILRFQERRKTPQKGEVGIVSNDAWLQKYGGWDPNPDEVIESKGMAYLKEIERDTHVSSCYRTRRNKLIINGWHITPTKEDRTEKIADFVRYNLDTALADRSKNGFDGDILGMMDAVAKGFSLSEIVWNQIRGGKYDGTWGISAIRKKEAEDYGFLTDKYGNVYADGIVYHGDYSASGERLPYNKFIHVVYGPDDENPYGISSTSRIAFWVWLKKNNSKFWAIYNEKFAMPTVVGKIPNNAQQDDIDLIDNFIKKLQSLSGVRIPDGFEISFLEAIRRGDVTYDNMIERCNKEISKEILGATLAIEEGTRGAGSYAHGSVHADVMDVYTFFDEVMISQSINNQLIKRSVDYNFLNIFEYPKFAFKRDWFADIVKIGQGLESLTRLGVGIPIDWIYARTGIPKPKLGETITEVLEKTLEQQDRGIDNKSKIVGGFSEIKFQEDRRSLTIFEERAQFNQQEKILDALESDALNKGAAILDTIFENVRDNIIKKINDQSGKQLAALPKFAVNIGKFKQLLTESAFQFHLTGMAFAKKEVQAAGVEFAEKEIPIEIGSIEQSIKLFSKLIPRTKSFFEKLFNFYDERFFHIAGLTQADIEKIFNTQLIGLENGWSLEDFKSAIAREKISYVGQVYGKDLTDVPIKANHLQVVFRNNNMKAYRDGRNEIYNDPDVVDFIWGYTYSAILDSRVRPSHAKLDGVTRPKEDIFWQRFDPPWDHNCRCLKFAIMKSDIVEGIVIPTSDAKMPAIPITEGWK